MSGVNFNDTSGKAQVELVSGTNIKTINGNSVLGSGNLVISGGGGFNYGTSYALAAGLTLYGY